LGAYIVLVAVTTTLVAALALTNVAGDALHKTYIAQSFD